MSNGKKKKMKKMACAAAAGMMSMSFIMPAFAQDEAITPKKADYGYYVEEYCKFESHIEIESEGKNINAKSLMGIMAFGLKKGMEVSISAKGTDEKAAVDCISQFLTSNAECAM